MHTEDTTMTDAPPRGREAVAQQGDADDDRDIAALLDAEPDDSIADAGMETTHHEPITPGDEQIERTRAGERDDGPVVTSKDRDRVPERRRAEMRKRCSALRIDTGDRKSSDPDFLLTEAEMLAEGVAMDNPAKPTPEAAAQAVERIAEAGLIPAWRVDGDPDRVDVDGGEGDE